MQVAFHGRLMTEQNIRAMVRAEVEEKAAIWRNRGARVSWNEESEVVEAEGRGWQLLNELLFGGQAVIRSTAIPGVMSISCDCSAALMQNATRPERRQAIEQISLRLNSNTILASNGSHGDAYWVWQWDNENLRVPESDKTIEAVLAVDWTWAIILFVMGCGGFTVLAGLTGAAGFFVLRRKRNASRLPRMA